MHCHPLFRVYYTIYMTCYGAISQRRPIFGSLFSLKELYTNLWTAWIRLEIKGHQIAQVKLMGIDRWWVNLKWSKASFMPTLLRNLRLKCLHAFWEGSEIRTKLGLPFPLATCIASNEAIDHCKQLIFVQRTWTCRWIITESAKATPIDKSACIASFTDAENKWIDDHCT